MRRPITLEEVYGQTKIKAYIKENIANNRFPNVTLLYGETGTGKTTLANIIAMMLTCSDKGNKPCLRCNNCKEAIKNLVKKNKETAYITPYTVSEDGGVEIAKSIKEKLNANFLSDEESRIIILNEAQRFTKSAQDLLLSKLEYLDNNVYVIMTTTDINNFQDAYLSRSLLIPVKRISQKECEKLLKVRAEELGLIIPNSQIFSMIAGYANGKPRNALKILDGFANIGRVDEDILKDIIGYSDTDKYIDLIATLNKSVVDGLLILDDLNINNSSLETLCIVLEEAIKIKVSKSTYRLGFQDTVRLREILKNIDVEVLEKFLYYVASKDKLTKQSLLSSYLLVQINKSKLNINNRREILNNELDKKRENSIWQGVENKIQTKPISIETLLGKGKIVQSD